MPSVKDQASALLSSIPQKQAQFDQDLSRLLLVFASRQRIAEGLEDDDVNADDADLYSDTTSVATGAASSVRGSARGKSHPASLMTR